MSERNPRIGILQASPRKVNSEAVARLVAERIPATLPDASVETFTLRHVQIDPCIACDICQETGDCFMTDGMDPFVDFLMRSDALVVVTPIYFAGPPAQLKAAFDRLQFLWARRYVLDSHPRGPRKPLLLIMVGTGQDPFGYQPVVTITHSALRMADFELSDHLPLIGYGEGSSEDDDAFHKQVRNHVDRMLASLEVDEEDDPDGLRESERDQEPDQEPDPTERTDG